VKKKAGACEALTRTILPSTAVSLTEDKSSKAAEPKEDCREIPGSVGSFAGLKPVEKENVYFENDVFLAPG